MLAVVIGMMAIAYTVQAKQAKAEVSQLREGEVCTISGIVVDKSGNAIPGVSIVIKDKPNSGVVTNTDGKFSITCNKGDVLIFTFIGYKSKEYVVTKSATNLKIVLDEDGEIIDEI